MMQSKKGGMMVEAALVMPIVILSMVTVICMLSTLFLIADQSAQFHTALRAEAARQTETASFSPVSGADFSMEKGIFDVSESLKIEPQRGFLLRKRKSMRVYSKSLIVDELRLMRITDYVKQ